MSRPTEWLRNARRRAGFGSQAALAKEMGVARGAIGNWESGRDRPSMENAERLAVVLRRQRSEVLAKFGYPIGGGEPLTELPIALPPEWLAALRSDVSAAVASGMEQMVREATRIAVTEARKVWQAEQGTGQTDDDEPRHEQGKRSA